MDKLIHKLFIRDIFWLFQTFLWKFKNFFNILRNTWMRFKQLDEILPRISKSIKNALMA